MKQLSIKNYIFILLMSLTITFGGFVNTVDAKSFAVKYTLTGILSVEKGVVRLNTEDGRVFKLLVKGSKVQKFNGKPVCVEGKVSKSDDLATFKVKSIKVVKPSEIIIPEIQHASYQRAATIKNRDNGKITIKNIRWDIKQNPKSKKKHAIHSWETVTIDPSKVKKAYFILKPFAPKFLAAHALFVFTFKPGGMVSSTGKESKALALTIEAFKRKGQSYGLIKTLKKVYDIVWILTTWANYATLNVKFGSGQTELFVYPINNKKIQAKALLLEAIKQATVNRQGEFYHTIRNNCVNNLVIMMNNVMSKKDKIRLWAIPSMIYNYKASMPFPLVKKLLKKKIISEAYPAVNMKNFAIDIDLMKKK